MSEPTRFEILREHIAEQAAACGGVWTLAIIRAADSSQLFLAAEQGDSVASRVLCCAGDTVTQVCADPAPCLLCDAMCSAEALPGVIIVLMPDIPTAAAAVSNVICPACASVGNVALRARAMDWYKRHFLPDLRALPPFAPGGNA